MQALHSNYESNDNFGKVTNYGKPAKQSKGFKKITSAQTFSAGQAFGGSIKKSSSSNTFSGEDHEYSPFYYYVNLLATFILANRSQTSNWVMNQQRNHIHTSVLSLLYLQRILCRLYLKKEEIRSKLAKRKLRRKWTLKRNTKLRYFLFISVVGF